MTLNFMKQNSFKRKIYVFTCISFLLFTVTLINAQQKTTIFDIARKGTLEQLKKMHVADANIINRINKEGYAPLTLACYYNNNEVAKYLIEHSEDIDSKSGYGTPLMAATVKKNKELIELLLKKGADPNKTDENGSTALHYAVIFNFEEIVELLVNANANSSLKDNREKTAFDYAKITNNKKIIELLKS